MLVGRATANEIGATFTSGAFFGPITALFGVTDSVHATPHSGTDIGVDEGTPVPSLAAGKVVYTSEAGTAGWAEIFGNSCIVDHGDGTRALYAHLRDVPAHAAGDLVDVGETLGLAGNTGYSFGAHLHLALSTDENPWFTKDPDGGVSRLLDPIAHLVASAPIPKPVTAEPAQPDPYILIAHAADYESAILGRLARMAEARVPRFVMQAEFDSSTAAVASLRAAIEALP